MIITSHGVICDGPTPTFFSDPHSFLPPSSPLPVVYIPVHSFLNSSLFSMFLQSLLYTSYLSGCGTVGWSPDRGFPHYSFNVSIVVLQLNFRQCLYCPLPIATSTSYVLIGALHIHIICDTLMHLRLDFDYVSYAMLCTPIRLMFTQAFVYYLCKVLSIEIY